MLLLLLEEENEKKKPVSNKCRISYTDKNSNKVKGDVVD
jgi:hypothetical protein